MNNRRFSFLLILVLLVSFYFVHANIEAFFSPNDKPTTKLLELINKATKSIHVAIYLLTDKKIAQALIEAKNKKNIDVTVILDPISADGLYGKANFLVQNNVPVFIFDPHPKNSTNKWAYDNPIMHNKFAIIDGATLWTGSFNWTVSANTCNYENVVVIDNQELCKKYEQHFSQLITSQCIKHNVTQIRNKTTSLKNKILDILDTAKNNTTIVEKLTNLLQNYHAME